VAGRAMGSAVRPLFWGFGPGARFFCERVRRLGLGRSQILDTFYSSLWRSQGDASRSLLCAGFATRVVSSLVLPLEAELVLGVIPIGQCRLIYCIALSAQVEWTRKDQRAEGRFRVMQTKSSPLLKKSQRVEQSARQRSGGSKAKGR
jgi:hypothetical protein